MLTSYVQQNKIDDTDNVQIGTLFSVGYSEKDVQDIRKNTQYQETGSLFTSTNTCSRKLDLQKKSSW